MSNTYELIEETERIIELGKKGLARQSEADELEQKIKIELEQLDPDSILGREYDYWVQSTIYKDALVGKFATPRNISVLARYKEFLKKYLEETKEADPQTQQFISKGEVYSGRKAIRQILGCATQYIDIQDSYLNLDLFNIVEPILETLPNIEIRLLTSIQTTKAFRSDLKLFIQQYPQVQVVINDDAHGRFVFIDKKRVFSTGSSVAQIGQKADLITEITIESEIEKAISNMEVWWSNGAALP